MKASKMKVIGAWGICHGLSLNVYDVQYGIDDRLIVGWSDEDQLYNLTIEYSNDNERYITLNGVNYYMKNCLRV